MAKEFVVIGLGTFGLAVARTLAAHSKGVVAIDREEKNINEITDVVTEAVVMDATDEKALKSLGIQDVDCAIVAVGDIQDSILITLLLKDMGIQKIIAKAINEQHKKVLEKIGASKIILPDIEVGENLALSLISTRIFDHIEMSEKYSMLEIQPLNRWIGKTIKQADIRNKYNVSIVGIKREFAHINEKGEKSIIKDIVIAPPGETVILKHDTLIVIGDKNAISKLK
ncbi:MAG: TrkA family potassium uptake protein [bacterium]|nr:TrkA family potassium uptake protein [bacterium]